MLNITDIHIKEIFLLKKKHENTITLIVKSSFFIVFCG